MGTFGIIAPHPPIMVAAVGKTRARATEASARAMARAAAALRSFAPDTVVVMSPHSPAASDAFAIDLTPSTSGTLAEFGAPDVELGYEIDVALSRTLLERGLDLGLPMIDRQSDIRLHSGRLDHGAVVPLSFLMRSRERRIVTLSLSGLPYEYHFRLGGLLSEVARETNTSLAFVASGDLSHRLTPDAPAGYSAGAHLLDEAIVGRVEKGDLESLIRIPPDVIEAGGECGLRSFIALAGFAGSSPVPSRVLSYEAPWGVGYLTALIGDQALAHDEAQAASGTETPQVGHKGGCPGSAEHEIVSLARQTIERFVRDGSLPDGVVLTDSNLPGRAGCFVSLHRNRCLRGCIGTIEPTCPSLAEEVVRNAIQAATCDSRFQPLDLPDLADLQIGVDVLHPPEPATREDLDAKRYGVIVSYRSKRGLLLPDLEGVADIETQLLIATRKAGIGPREPYIIERFRVDRYL